MVIVGEVAGIQYFTLPEVRVSQTAWPEVYVNEICCIHYLFPAIRECFRYNCVWKIIKSLIRVLECGDRSYVRLMSSVVQILIRFSILLY